MKILKLVALFMALSMLLAFGVACNSDEGEGTTEGAQSGDNGNQSEAPAFIVELTVIVLDADGKEVTLIDKEDAQYNGLKPTNELTMFDIISDYCFDNDIECVLDEQTGRLQSIGEYTVANGGYRWVYELNGDDLKDYDLVIENGAEIVVKMQKV